MSDDELPLPRARLSSPFESLSVNNNGKRPRLGRDVSSDHSSSDAAFFSSDDLAEASVEKYDSPARKKQYRRAWYEPETPNRALSYQQMRAMTRVQKDSGIYMNSDSSTSSFSSDGFDVDVLAQKAKQQGDLHIAALTARKDGEAPKKSRDDTLVEQAVTRCLESHEESLDFTNCGLSQLSDEAIRPLHHLIRKPTFAQARYTEQACDTLVPALKLFLASNSLSALPSELFRLETLTVLSVRRNFLEQLAPSIGNLINLVELNVSANELRWLPCELISLCAKKLKRLTARPNPLLIPKMDTPDASSSPADEDAPGPWLLWRGLLKRARDCQGSLSNEQGLTSWTEAGNRAAHLRTSPVYLGRTRTRWFDLTGEPCTRSGSHPSRSYADEVDVLSVEQAADECTSLALMDRHVPTLFESCLRVCSNFGATGNLSDLVTADAPPGIHVGLHRASIAARYGKNRCSVCDDLYVVPRAERIEFWYCAEEPDADAVHDTPRYDSAELKNRTFPFLRSFCSWICARDAKVVHLQ